MMTKQTFVLLGILCLGMTSCVSLKRFDDLNAKHKMSEADNARLKAENKDMSTRNAELTSGMGIRDRQLNALIRDSIRLANAMQALSEQCGNLRKSYESLLQSSEQMRSGNAAESRKIMEKLQQAQSELQQKEDLLKKTGRELTEKEQHLNELNSRLEQREARVRELEQILHRKDSTVSAIRNAVANALLGFKDFGLSVYEKNGKVYVSLEERLLFASGSTVVDKKGEEALKQLAKVLEKNQDINVMIEGHTDNVPYTGSGSMKDNWDLSVMRATAIVRILTANSKLDARKLTVAGRGEYVPVDPASTPEARKKNRRTEIILTPKLDELLRVLEAN